MDPFRSHECEHQDSLYLAEAPEYGKQAFRQRLQREILRAKQDFPKALYPSIAAGAASKWRFLEQHSDRQLIDFLCATKHVDLPARSPKRPIRSARPRASGRSGSMRTARCSSTTPGSLDDALIGDAARLSQRHSLSQTVRGGATSAGTYFTKHRHQTDYPGFLAEDVPIGSGVTDGDCKTVVKQHPCASGMRWNTEMGGHRSQPARPHPNCRTPGAVLAEN